MHVLKEASRMTNIAIIIISETLPFAGLIEVKDIPPSKDVWVRELGVHTRV
jgi:hypothetical protein